MEKQYLGKSRRQNTYGSLRNAEDGRVAGSWFLDVILQADAIRPAMTGIRTLRHRTGRDATQVPSEGVPFALLGLNLMD